MLFGFLQQPHAERAARAEEREMSAVLQRSLLPDPPDLSGISSAARTRALAAYGPGIATNTLDALRSCREQRGTRTA